MTKEQIKILKKLNKGTLIDFRYCSSDEEDICDYLESEKYAKLTSPEPNENGHVPCVYVISQLGKSKLHEIYSIKQRFLIDWIRYIITTLIALAAFVKSFFFI